MADTSLNGASRVGEVVLDVQQLTVERGGPSGPVRLVDGVDLQLRAGETLGLVGESGSGKTMTCLALVGVLPDGVRASGGQIFFEGRNLLELSETELRSLRGARIAMILQDPLTSLNPVLTLGYQVAEPLRFHNRVPPEGLQATLVRILESVRISSPALRLGQYPHQLSGGMRQRAVIGIGLACEPTVLIADEPTSALDVTTQAQILRLLREVQERRQGAVLLVSHDFGVVRTLCDRVAVMYAGRVVESAPVQDILDRPQHPYTVGLLNSVPRLGERRRRLEMIPGQPPDPASWPAGCRFAPRCPRVMPICERKYPPAVSSAPGQTVECWLYADAPHV